MGLDELLHTLRKNEQKHIGEIWQAAEKEAETLREQIAEAVADISEKQAAQLASACRKSMRTILAGAEVKTREKKLLTYRALEQILQKTARRQLPELRNRSYEKIFAGLVGELPEGKWETVAVNPADVDLAAEFFAADIIKADAAISGGLKALTAGGRITVDNTFEKRLERKWPRMLPALIAAIEKQNEK